jgi:hypothetical protein
MRTQIVKLVEKLTFYKVRGQKYFWPQFQPSLRWWWTPWTYRFNHGGWIYLSIRWLWRFHNAYKKHMPWQVK